MKIEKMSPGMTVYEVGKTRMGNTTMCSVGTWQVRIESVNLENRTVMASWNGNRVERYSEQRASKWRAQKPMLVKSGFGLRLATREEIKAMKQAAKK